MNPEEQAFWGVQSVLLTNANDCTQKTIPDTGTHTKDLIRQMTACPLSGFGDREIEKMSGDHLLSSGISCAKAIWPIADEEVHGLTSGPMTG